MLNRNYFKLGAFSSREEIVAHQNTRLRRLVAHAYHNVSYYRRLFNDHGIQPQDIRSVEDLHLIPMSSKAELQQHTEDFLSRGFKASRMIVHKTSSSTGQPATIYNSYWEEHLRHIRRWRLNYYYGLRPGDRKTRIVMIHPSLPIIQLLLKVLSVSGIYKQIDIDCLQSPEQILQQLSALGPTVIVGFPGVINQVAQVVLKSDCKSIRPRCLTVGGEMLTPSMRHNISAAFGAPVYDVYSSHEFNLIAWECIQSGLYHVCDDSVVLEVLSEGRPVREGECGEVVGTNLHSFAMPFIRFRLGDLVVKGPKHCPCGEPFSTLSALQGRVLDYFRLPDGRVIHPFSLPVGLTPWIRNFTLVQECEDLIIAYVVASPDYTTHQVEELKKSVHAVLGPGIKFAINFVPSIKPASSGKFQPYRTLARNNHSQVPP